MKNKFSVGDTVVYLPDGCHCEVIEVLSNKTHLTYMIKFSDNGTELSFSDDLLRKVTKLDKALK